MYLLQMQHETKTEKDQKPNQTGIPSYMKQDFEARTSLSYDDVRIHYSSPKPAELGALAYTQGSHVYIGPGQEQHLPHELVHVAQQKRGKVRPTGRLGGVSVNDDPELERQADEGIVIQRAQAPSGPISQIVQRKIGMEYQTVGGEKNVFRHQEGEKPDIYRVCGVTLFTTITDDIPIKVTVDDGDLEYVTPAVDSPEDAYAAGRAAAKVHERLMNKKIPQNVDRGRVISNDSNDSNDEFLYEGYIYTFKNLGPTAHPQATVGIRMSRIADLLADLGGGNGNMSATEGVPLGLTSSKLPKDKLEAQKQTMKEASDNAKAVVGAYLSSHRNQKAKDRASIEGLLSLLFAYNAQFQIIRRHPEAALNAKNAMPVMNRTSLYDAYCTLNSNDQTIFLNVLQNELNPSSGQQTGEWIKGPIEKTDEQKLEEEGVLGPIEITLAGQRVGPLEAFKWKTVSLEKWFQNLRLGVDALSTSSFSAIGGIVDSDLEQPNKFGITRSTDIGMEGVPGLLVELRGLRRCVPHNLWGEIAKRVAKLVNKLNRKPEESDGCCIIA